MNYKQTVTVRMIIMDIFAFSSFLPFQANAEGDIFAFSA